MDEPARKSARTRAAIAFGLAGVLLVVNVAAAVAWREDRRDRFEGDRIEFDGRTDGDDDGSDERRQGGHGGQGMPDGPMGPGPGSGDQGGRVPMGPGGPLAGRGADDEDRDSTGSDGSDDDEQTREGTA
jgi:hypothetical protein